MNGRIVLLALLAGCTVEDADLLQNPAMSTLDVTASTDQLAIRSSQITGTLTLGYTSDQLVAIRILDNGAPVWAGTSPAADLAIPIDATITLDPFENDVVVEATYNGQVAQQQIALAVPVLDPTVAFPTFTNTYTPRVGMITTGSLAVSAPEGYTVDAVTWSVDGGAWNAAVALDTGGWGVEIVDPDIGTSRIDVTVTTSTGDYAHDTTFTGSFSVAPVFDCEPTSMLPDNDMIQNIGTEERALIGYFGRPEGGHFVQFTVEGQSNGDNYLVVGRNLRVDPAAIETEFNISRIACNNNNDNNCGTPYTLTAYVDGSQVCNRANFGQISRY